MKDLVEAATGYKVIHFNKNNKNNKYLLLELIKLCNILIHSFKTKAITRKIYNADLNIKTKSFRNNEIGGYCEFKIKDEFYKNKTKFKYIQEIIPLSNSGYPDLKIITRHNKLDFIEIKATSKPNIGSPRDFYYTPGSNSDKKINSDASHLLVGFTTKQKGKERFNLIGFKIVDVSKIKVSLKPEFNTDNLGIYAPDTILFQT